MIKPGSIYISRFGDGGVVTEVEETEAGLLVTGDFFGNERIRFGFIIIEAPAPKNVIDDFNNIPDVHLAPVYIDGHKLAALTLTSIDPFEVPSKETFINSCMKVIRSSNG